MISRFLFRLLLITSLVSVGVWLYFKPSPTKAEDKYVNVYCWYGLIDMDIIKEFESETGISVRLDSYDNNEVLEAKLLASNSGFDVVFPTVTPYVSWQIQAGVYQKIDKSLLPNISEIDPFVAKLQKNIDKDLDYAIPYFWGTIGIVYNKDVLDKVFPGGYTQNLSLIFNEENLKRLSKYGVSLLEESVDVIPFALMYINKNPNSGSSEDLDLAAKHLMKMRPYIKRFTSSKVVNDLVLGDTAIALVWSGEAQQAIQEAKEQGKNIEYFVPPEGGIVWIDTMAIPKGAPHPKNAHAFINFLLQPRIAARICQSTLHGVSISNAKKYLPSSILKNEGIYPGKNILKKLFLNNPPQTTKEQDYERERTRVWAKIRLNEY
ncbi:MAG: extracellular solute-binding protein [Alphaproteobacteria bacterium]